MNKIMIVNTNEIRLVYLYSKEEKIRNKLMMTFNKYGIEMESDWMKKYEEPIESEKEEDSCIIKG